MPDLEMPPARDFGWELKGLQSTYFEIVERANGQFCVVLNHSLLRGVSSEMIAWWFRNFANLKVTLQDVPGYEGAPVQAYLLWHPSDHHSVALSGAVAPDGSARAGADIQIREAMQYLKYGWKYPVDSKLRVFYCGPDGWAMGRQLPLLGKAMVLRIHFRDVVEDGAVIGAHYHYEIVVGLSGDGILARQLNKRITAEFSPEFFEAWQTHNAIEVGVFENFLPALYAQRDSNTVLSYGPEMNQAPKGIAELRGWDKTLFEARVAGYKNTDDPYAYQSYDGKSFL